MITKQKTMQFISSDGQVHPTLESAKEMELALLVKDQPNTLAALVNNPRAAIAILRVGLPRKPRTVKISKKKPTKAELVNKPT